MVYNDPLSQWCLAKDPKWPPKSFLKQEQFELDAINSQLRQYEFDIKEWKEYKLKVPNDGRIRQYSHQEVEYQLTKEEYQGITEIPENGVEPEYWVQTYCNPTLCPKYWAEYAQNYGPFEQRFWWILIQENWLVLGFPQLPRVIWDKDDFILEIFEDLIYNPFIEYWGSPPDKFWIYLSNYLEGENHHSLVRGFVLYFHSIGRIFPSPAHLENIEEHNPDEIFK